MTAMVLRIIIFAVIGIAIYLGVRKIWRDWTGQFKAEEKAVHQRDLQERKRADVIELKRGPDGTYRPSSGGDDKSANGRD